MKTVEFLIHGEYVITQISRPLSMAWSNYNAQVYNSTKHSLEL